VLVCSCCGGWTVEQVVLDVPPYGRRARLKVCTPFSVRYVARSEEAAAILAQGGVLDRMREIPAPKTLEQKD
jgi:hypothetical protein